MELAQTIGRLPEEDARGNTKEDVFKRVSPIQIIDISPVKFVMC